jgi:flagellar basal-body rod modification protein FlgD
MAITAAVNPLDLINATGGAKTASGSTTSTKADTSATDRFLKLLVTQMQNQDPLNPMDNAQVTSQMAQISTVSGISDLNTTMSGLNAQFVQLQAVQGASLVGHDVTLVGNQLDVTTDSGVGVGGFELASSADSVKVQVMDGAGTVLETLNLGAQPAGMNGFSWKGAANDTPYTFKVTATAAGSDLKPTPLMRDHVYAVAIVNNKLTLETAKSGPVEYSTVRAVS